MDVTTSPRTASRASRVRRVARRVTGLAWLLSGVGLAAVTQPANPPANPTGTAVLEFHKRIEEYGKLRDRATVDVPKLKETPSPAEIAAREKAMAGAIRAARKQAQPGDLFGPVETLFRKIVREDWASRPPADRRGLAADMPRVGRVIVNTEYPPSMPLSTVPPGLLQQLPRLPDSLEYRLMGRYLVLRDVSANLIVDVLERALPSR
jgi:hypothetical protein